MTVPEIRPQESDDVLISRVRAGDEAAFGELAGRYQPLLEGAVRRFAPSFSGTEGDAAWGEDDLHQCAALALYRAVMSYETDGRGREVRFGLYAKICVNNALIFELRKVRAQAGRRERKRRAGGSRRETDPLQSIVSAEDAAELEEKIRDVLAPLEREVFERRTKGMSIERIAVELGKDRKAVSNALYRMKVKIKGLLHNQI